MNTFMELGLLIVCNAGILAFWILGIIGALSPGPQQQGKRKREEVDE